VGVRYLVAVSLAAGAAILVGCSGAYYSALETIGVEKRELLADRVEAARDEQAAAQQQFRDALEQFKAVAGYRGGELEAMYEKLRGEYEGSAARAQAVRDRISAVQDVAEALFAEWEEELAQYSDPKLRRSSQKQLTDTRRRYGQLVTTMQRASSRMDPILAVLKDHVLFLKHNLNAQALGSLAETTETLQTDVDRLIRDMQAAITEADSFLGTLQTGH
jgi:hypothetical protein